MPGTRRSESDVYKALAFTRFLQLGDKRVRTAGEVALVLPDLPTGPIQHHNRRKTLDLVPHGQFLVLLTKIGALRFASGKIDLHQDEVLVRILFKLWLRKNLFVQPDTITAPIGAGEIQKHQFV